MGIKKAKPGSGNRIRSHETSDKRPGLECPAFSLRFIVGEYCITRCSNEQAMQFANKLRMLSQLTWQQISNSDPHKLGCEKIHRNAIRRPIPKHVTEDVTLLSFRCFGMAPMIGYRDGGVFYVLWFDPGMEVYKH